jgi:hypothetical protein
MQWLVLLPVRWRVFRHDRRRRPVFEGAVRTIQHTHAQAATLGLTNLTRLYNVALFILLLDADLSQLSSDMVNASTDRRRKFVARQMAVLLYEVAKDLPELLGKDFRAGLVDLNLGGDTVSSLDQIRKRLGQFKDQHSVQLNQIRSLVGAHREHDAIAQLQLLETLKPLEIFALAAEFSGSLRELVTWMTDVMGTTGRLDSVVRQLVSKGIQAQSN